MVAGENNAQSRNSDLHLSYFMSSFTIDIKNMHETGSHSFGTFKIRGEY